MARPRSESKKDLPLHLHEPRVGYYTYRDPVTKKTRAIGRDRDAAVRYATRMNEMMGIAPASAVIAQDFGFAGTLNAEYIVGLAKPVKKTCGIYFLMQGSEIVYVGQSVNCNLRIGNHLNDEQKVFDSYFVVECIENRLDEMEAKYIVKLRPKYNLAIPKVASEISKLFAMMERAEA
jgi:hypothetical protein